MPRYTASFKASGLRSTNGRQQNGTFFWAVDDDAAEIIAARIASLSNGTLVGLSKQIMDDPTNGNGPYGDATANGGSDRANILTRDNLGHTQQFNLPFLKHSIEKTEIESIFEATDSVILNRDEVAAGQVVNIQMSQIVDGVPAPAPA